ncbi:MAG: dihydrolipoamide acetyltransferase family protein [Propionicimonas sp.]|uniref:dihydrolipoamide acetyltransferase family protein n=1 Tax=Propionicimonas sp. TaxID=1955623 RepID=UPI003D14617E
MAQVVVMPQLGNTVESCLVTAWLVKVGDVVDASTLLCEIETDKSSMEVPSGVAGTVLALLAAEGDDVPVKEPLVIVGEPGEDIAGLVGGGAAPATLPDEPEGVEPASGTVPEEPARNEPASRRAAVTDTPAEGISPRARALAASQGIAADLLAGTGPHGRVIERDVQEAIAAGPGLTAGARAEASGFVPGAAGTGIGGRVTRADLAATTTVAEEPARNEPASRSPQGSEFPGAYTDTPLKGIRKVIAERMMNSLATSAQLTYTATAPAAGLLALRKRLKGASDPELAAVTIGDMVGYAAVRTLLRHPVVNAHLSGGVLREFASVHLGMAVDTPRGLLVPTLQFADTLTLRDFSVRCKALANAAIGGSISPDLLGGASFTVSNLGAFGIEWFTPLLNVPQVAILGVDAIFPRAVINADGSVGAEQRIGFSLTADHQVIDGADAARFLKDLCAAVADIDLTVLG